MTGTGNTGQIRDIVFLSHANPEDNQFTRWLAAKLLQHGYLVFCDLADFKGGEDFWRDAETAIRHRAAKFVYILSRSSNAKQGPLNELRVASNVARDNNLRDFTIPVLVDDLPMRDANIEISRLNIIPAEQDWAAALRALLEKLGKDGVPRLHSREVSGAIPQWSATSTLSSETEDIPEQYASNWFSIVNLPQRLFVHRLSGPDDLRDVAGELPLPAVATRRSIVTFGAATEISPHLPTGVRLIGSTELPAMNFRLQHGRDLPSGPELRRMTSQLLRIGFEQLCVSRGLVRHRMANEAQCLFFPGGLLDDDKVHFNSFDGRATWRKMVGYKSRTGRDGERLRRYWHFGVQVRPIFDPMPAFALTSHVLFSDDGKSIWRSAERLHRARRSQCKDWWNDDWRDRLLSAMDWLAVDGRVSIPMSEGSIVGASASTITFESPVSFREPGRHAEGAAAEVLGAEAT